MQSVDEFILVDVQLWQVITRLRRRNPKFDPITRRNRLTDSHKNCTGDYSVPSTGIVAYIIYYPPTDWFR